LHEGKVRLMILSIPFSQRLPSILSPPSPLGWRLLLWTTARYEQLQRAEQLHILAGVEVRRAYSPLGQGVGRDYIGRQRDGNVRGNPLVPDRLPAWCKPFLSGNQQGGAVGQVELLQHRARAKGLLAHQRS